jgi:hypothetical protein
MHVIILIHVKINISRNGEESVANYIMSSNAFVSMNTTSKIKASPKTRWKQGDLLNNSNDIEKIRNLLFQNAPSYDGSLIHKKLTEISVCS